MPRMALGLLVFTYFEFIGAPTGFVPQQDKLYLATIIQLPPISTTCPSARR